MLAMRFSALKGGRRLDRHYVSEFTAFMDKYLKEHPEVAQEQARGWDIYWNPERGPERPEEFEDYHEPDARSRFSSLR